MRRIRCLLLVIMLLAASLVPAMGWAEDAKPVEVVVFHTNDVHARVPYATGQMGYAMASAYVNAARAARQNVLLLDAGDTFHGQVIATVTKGESIAKILNTMGYDAMSPGNHDFNYGIDRLLELDALTDFPLLSCNVRRDGEAVFAPYIIKEFGDVKVGVIGAENPDILIAVHPDGIKGVTIEGVDTVKAAVEAIKDETDAIIVLCHWGSTGVETASDEIARIEGVDLVIDGHSHSLYPEGHQVEGGCLVASTGEYLNNLGKVTLTIDKAASTVQAKAELIPCPPVTPDTAVGVIIEDISAEQATLFETVVGKTEVALDGARENVRTKETNLANLICDAILDITGADCVLTNGGGIRDNINVGDISLGEVITVLPFGNYVVTKQVTGEVIVAALEHGARLYPDQNGGFAQVAGITYQIDAKQPAGSRIVNVTVAGEPVDLAKEYVLATNDFMAAGGDGYTMFADAPKVFEYGALDEVLIAYLTKVGTANPVVDGRITVIE